MSEYQIRRSTRMLTMAQNLMAKNRVTVSAPSIMTANTAAFKGMESQGCVTLASMGEKNLYRNSIGSSRRLYDWGHDYPGVAWGST